MTRKPSAQLLPWSENQSIEPFLSEFPRPIGIMVLGKRDHEGATWLIHEVSDGYAITCVQPGGLVECILYSDSHPLQIEGHHPHRLNYGVHMDAKPLAPMQTVVIPWLTRLCKKSPESQREPQGFEIGDVIFTGDNRIIRSATGSDWSHAALYIGKGRIAEALKGQSLPGQPTRKSTDMNPVFITPVEEYRTRKHIAVLRHPDWRLLSSEDFSAAVGLGLSEGYSVASAIRSLLHRYGPVDVGARGIFCSQMILSVYGKLRLNSLVGIRDNPYEVTPEDLYRILLDKGFELVTQKIDGRPSRGTLKKLLDVTAGKREKKSPREEG